MPLSPPLSGRKFGQTPPSSCSFAFCETARLGVHPLSSGFVGLHAHRRLGSVRPQAILCIGFATSGITPRQFTSQHDSASRHTAARQFTPLQSTAIQSPPHHSITLPITPRQYPPPDQALRSRQIVPRLELAPVVSVVHCATLAKNGDCGQSRQKSTLQPATYLLSAQQNAKQGFFERLFLVEACRAPFPPASAAVHR